MSLNRMSPSELLATSCYTRGLWSSVFVWRAISHKPYRGSPIQWGLDIDVVKFHLKRAALLGTGFLLVYLLVLKLLFVTKSPWLFFLLLFILSVEWLLLPWAVLKFGYVKDNPRRQSGTVRFGDVVDNRQTQSRTVKIGDVGYNSQSQSRTVKFGGAEDHSQARSRTVTFGGLEDNPQTRSGMADSPEISDLVRRDSVAALPDLGFLLREATFSVDCTARQDPAQRPDADLTQTPSPDEFYDAILSAVSRVTGFRSVPLAIKTSKDRQPGSPLWGAWYRPRCRPNPSESASITRLVILDEQLKVDGFAATEFMAQEVGPHLSFVLRLRWMPPLSKRLHRLAFLGQQHAWWRAFVVPIVLVSIALLIDWALGATLGPLKSISPGAGSYADLASNLLSGLGLGAFEVLLLPIVLVLIFMPVVVLFLILIRRGLRYLYGALCAATGTYMEIDAPCALRFLSSRALIENGEELQRGIVCCQVMQEVLTNCIINTLHKYGIDTRSIRDEVTSFINQGIYMTGGSIVAENIAAGRLAKIIQARGNIKKSRRGQRSLVSGHAQAA